MLETNNMRRLEWRTAPAVDVSSAAEFYAESLGFFRRQGFIIVLALLLSLAFGALYFFTTPSRYTGRATLIVDAPRTQFFQSQTPPGEAPGVIDSATVDTQIQILKSDDLALSVIRMLHLSDDAEFVSPATDIVGMVAGVTRHAFTSVMRAIAPSLAKNSDQPSPEERALRTFQDHLRIDRVGLTYAIAINFESPSPYRAAQIANAIADAYELAAFQAKYQITGRSATWLQDRLKDLREQASAAERAVVDYKTEHNIVDTGGQLMNEQQLAELNSQLVQAHA
jgi:polysaccharide biosynthesis transport protein